MCRHSPPLAAQQVLKAPPAMTRPVLCRSLQLRSLLLLRVLEITERHPLTRQARAKQWERIMLLPARMILLVPVLNTHQQAVRPHPTSFLRHRELVANRQQQSQMQEVPQPRDHRPNSQVHLYRLVQL